MLVWVLQEADAEMDKKFIWADAWEGKGSGSWK